MTDTDLATDGAETPWHAISVDETSRRLSVDIRSGLTDMEAAERHLRFGANAVRKQPPRSIRSMILGQLSDFMILVLLAAAAVAGVIGDPQDSIVIVVIVVLNAIVGVVQEWRAERALAALRGMTAPSARILRDGTQRIVSTTEVVPGDIVVLSEGDIVPADLRLIETATLSADESMLTGESVPVDKNLAPVGHADAPLVERTNMAFKGTLITHGRGIGVAVATGMASALGRIAGMLDTAERLQTPLQRRLERFGRWIGVAVLGVCAIVLVFGLLRGEPPFVMFLTAVSLAVAAVPEALPAVVTIALALGAREMMRQNALVRALPAVETLGSVTTICTDKTGTLTQNKMQVDTVIAGHARLSLEAGARADQRASELLTAMALCNDAEVNAQAAPIGDPTEITLASCAASAGLVRGALEARLPRIGEIAFDSERKRMTTVHASRDDRISYTKGAPEAVLPRCTRELAEGGELQTFDVSTALAEANRMAEQGLRVIAFAKRYFPAAAATSTEPHELEREMTFIALVGLLDPPRAEANDAVAECRLAGITPIMITGDHPSTARQIGERLGFVTRGDTVVTGSELRDMSDREFAARIDHVRVYARTDPVQKIRIVEALQSRGEIVAMTGDGVNDAPALKRADIGVAMGLGGTDVAREAASLVLLDDNFATIVAAVRAGRRIYDDIRKFIKYTMTSNSGEIWTIFLAPFLGLPIPLLPIHILWINLVTDGLPGLALAVEPEEEGVMKRPPRRPEESIFAHGMWQHIIWCGLAMAIVCLGTQAWAIATGHDDTWQTMVLTVLTLSQMGHVLAIRSEEAPLISARFFANRSLLGAVALTFALQLAIIYVPALNPIFKTTPLSASELAICIALSAVVAGLVEVEKWLIRNRLIYQSPG
jgi:P-type Ca2+ transporter type 2C